MCCGLSQAAVEQLAYQHEGWQDHWNFKGCYCFDNVNFDHIIDLTIIPSSFLHLLRPQKTQLNQSSGKGGQLLV